MELKKFQKEALVIIEKYLSEVAKQKEAGNIRYASLAAWENLNISSERPYQTKRNGLGEDVPNFVMKIPTGGGKTLLAVKTIDVINSSYRKKKTGLVLWIVPTDSIFKQTVKNLKDRNHPYRQHLDIASGGRTIIKEKYRGRIDKFTPLDVEENLVVYVLMLQAAARRQEVRDDLKIFADSGGFDSFFPPDDRLDKHEKLLQLYPNLDVFNKEEVGRRQVKTSLGNTLRLLKPIVILDESQKAYTPIAINTILSFNPSIIVELSATPPAGSNVLVKISGKQLNDEEMIKLDLHIINRQYDEWKAVLHASKQKRDELEKIALENERRTGVYIRPILLLQAERTGKDQRGQGYIHSEDIKEELLRLGVNENEIAIKTSEQDELKAAEEVGGLMSRDCPIRYIITKYALQEGWDCPFAYILAILAYHTTHAEKALTQLVGRILRQPYAKKTGIKVLDESYVYVYHQESHKVLENVRRGLIGEGLSDITTHIQVFGDTSGIQETPPPQKYKVRKEFIRAAKKVLLPFFMTKENGCWRWTNYERDILSKIDWNKFDYSEIIKLHLTDQKMVEEYVASLSDDEKKVIEIQNKYVEENCSGFFNITYAVEYLSSIIPNPWVAYELVNKVFSGLEKKYNKELVAKNLFLILAELKKKLSLWLDQEARKIFELMLQKDQIRLMLIKNQSYRLPQELELRPTTPLLNRYHKPLQKSLFDFVPADSVNTLEKNVVYFLEDQDKLYFWYRNIARNDYGLQAWRKDKIYADFIFTIYDKTRRDVGKVYVLETKGEHLAGNRDTEYKKSVFNLCNQLLNKAVSNFIDKDEIYPNLEYKIVTEDEWQNELINVFLDKN